MDTPLTYNSDGGASRKIPILLVDDNPANLLALEHLLACDEYAIVKAFSGNEALRCLLKEEFALVILDVLMPEMDGFETAKMIRSRRQSSHTPIIFTTAADADETRVRRGYALGAIDYLHKPVVPEILSAKVKVFVDLYKQSRMLIASKAAMQLERERKAMQRQFIATVSHELRTPIAAIKASAETLRHRGHDAADIVDPRRFMAIIESNADRLGLLVEDLLTLSELESDKAHPEPQQIALVYFVKQFISSILPLAALKKISITVDIDKAITVWMDPKHLSRVLQNLLDNAIKYNKEKGAVRVEGRCIGGSEAQVSIRDTGIGIRSEELPLIFRQFHRTAAVRASSSRGTGLGLYLVRNILEANGGRIWVGNIKDNGSVFHFTIPLAPRAATSSPDQLLKIGR